MSDQDQRPETTDLVIIGGSLVGLTFALACAQRGIRTRVLEQGHGRHHSGSALAVDRPLLMRVVGADPTSTSAVEPFPVITEYRQAVSWRSLHAWLYQQAAQRPEIRMSAGLKITEVVQSNDIATVVTASGEKITAPVVVGADGYRSVVRKAICEEHPDAVYAGYLLWRALVPESDLPADTPFPQDNDGVALCTETGYRLIAYPVAAPDGSLEPGHRLISFAWYDAGRTALLRDLGCLSASGGIVSSFHSENIPAQVREELRALAQRIWPEPWRAAIVHALDRRQAFATPVAEYDPIRLHRERLAIIGDAAHVVSPATGLGFVAGILDAEALAGALAGNYGGTSVDVCHALEEYGRRRLPAARQLATRSKVWSRAFLSGSRMPRTPVFHTNLKT